MNDEFEKAAELYRNAMYQDALKILLRLEKESIADKSLRLNILKSISESYRDTGDFKSAFEYYDKYAEEEYQDLQLINKEKTDKLNSTLKIHQSQKENVLLEQKNKELLKANTELNNLRERKNEMLEIISEELKIPIVTIEGISLNQIRASENGTELNTESVKDELERIETLASEILEKVNAILQKNKEEYG